MRTQSAQIAVLCVLVGAACFVLRKRTSHLRYLLWLLIVAKCLAPPLVTVSLAILPNEPEVPIPAVVFSERVFTSPVARPYLPFIMGPVPCRICVGRFHTGSTKWNIRLEGRGG